MQITFLGTGTSQGIPVIGCECKACRSADSKDKRLRSSVLIENDDLTLIIDAGPDFRQQMLSANVKKLDAVLVTHPHKDHIGGLDDVRAFNYLQKKPMDIYIKGSFIPVMKNEFFYAFEEDKYPGVPEFNLIPVDKKFKIKNLEIIPIHVMHHKMGILGFRIGNFTYITDASYIAKEQINKILGTELLVVNGIREKKHFAHFNLKQALDFIQAINPQRAFITHISHMMGPQKIVSKKLPENVALASDGLKLEIEHRIN